LIENHGSDRPSKVENINLRSLSTAWELVESGAETGAFAGAVGLVSKNGKILLHESCGFASIYPSRVLMHRNSIFDLASITKAVATTTAILLLVERGAIGLNEKVGTYLTGFGNTNWKKIITVEQLLTHTSGLPAWSDLYARHKRRVSMLHEVSNDIDSIVKPGTAFAYSDIGFILLGRLIEVVSGRRLDSFVNREIFSPLGMNDTCYNPKSKSNRLVSTEYSNWRGEFVRGKVHDENAYAMDGVSGHAGLFSTARDLAKLSSKLLGHDRGFLSSETISRMTADHTSRLGEIGRAHV
jgi:serine-type D-Ala-D-Ala carboxypeptidase